MSKKGPVEQEDLYGMAKQFALSVGKGETQPKFGSEDNEETTILILGSGV